MSSSAPASEAAFATERTKQSLEQDDVDVDGDVRDYYCSSSLMSLSSSLLPSSTDNMEQPNHDDDDKRQHYYYEQQQKQQQQLPISVIQQQQQHSHSSSSSLLQVISTSGEESSSCSCSSSTTTIKSSSSCSASRMMTNPPKKKIDKTDDDDNTTTTTILLPSSTNMSRGCCHNKRNRSTTSTTSTSSCCNMDDNSNNNLNNINHRDDHMTTSNNSNNKSSFLLTLADLVKLRKRGTTSIDDVPKAQPNNDTSAAANDSNWDDPSRGENNEEKTKKNVPIVNGRLDDPYNTKNDNSNKHGSNSSVRGSSSSSSSNNGSSSCSTDDSYDKNFVTTATMRRRRKRKRQTVITSIVQKYNLRDQKVKRQTKKNNNSNNNKKKKKIRVDHTIMDEDIVNNRKDAKKRKEGVNHNNPTTRNINNITTELYSDNAISAEKIRHDGDPELQSVVTVPIRQDVLLSSSADDDDGGKNHSKKKKKKSHRLLLSLLRLDPEWLGNVYFEKVVDNYRIAYMNNQIDGMNTNINNNNNNNNNSVAVAVADADESTMNDIRGSLTTIIGADDLNTLALSVMNEMHRVGGRFLYLMEQRPERDEQVTVQKDSNNSSSSSSSSSSCCNSDTNSAGNQVETQQDEAIILSSPNDEDEDRGEQQQKMAPRALCSKWFVLEQKGVLEIIRKSLQRTAVNIIPQHFPSSERSDDPMITILRGQHTKNDHNNSLNVTSKPFHNELAHAVSQAANEMTNIPVSQYASFTNQESFEQKTSEEQQLGKTEQPGAISNEFVLPAPPEVPAVTEIQYSVEDIQPPPPLPPMHTQQQGPPSARQLEEQRDLSEVCARIQIHDPAVTCVDIAESFTDDMISMLGQTLYQTMLDHENYGMQQHVKAMGLEISKVGADKLPSDNERTKNTFSGPYRSLFLYLEQSSALQTVFLNGCGFSSLVVVERFVQSLARSPALEYLMVCDVSLPMSSFTSLLQTTQSIRHLELEGCILVSYQVGSGDNDSTISNDLDERIINSRKALPSFDNRSLRHITFKGEDSFQDSFLIPILLQLPMCSNLEQISWIHTDNRSPHNLVMKSTGVSREVWQSLAKVIVECKSMNHLSFSSWTFQGDTLLPITQAIHKCSAKSFQISFASACRADLAATRSIMSMFGASDDALSCMPSTTSGANGQYGATSLHIGNGCKFSKPTTTLVMTIMSRPGNSMLDLQLRALGSCDLERILRRIMSSSSLKRLDLGSICFTDIRRLRTLIHAIPFFTTLKELILHVNGSGSGSKNCVVVGQQIKSELLQAFKRNRSLFQVHFLSCDENDDDCQMSDDGSALIPARTWTEEEGEVLSMYWKRNRFLANENSLISNSSLFPVIARCALQCEYSNDAIFRILLAMGDYETLPATICCKHGDTIDSSVSLSVSQDDNTVNNHEQIQKQVIATIPSSRRIRSKRSCATKVLVDDTTAIKRCRSSYDRRHRTNSSVRGVA